MKSFCIIKALLALMLFAHSRALHADTFPASTAFPVSAWLPLAQERADRVEESDLVRRSEIISIGQDVRIKANEICRDVVVVGADAHIEGTVEGTVTVILGSVNLTGQIKRGMVVVLGSADLGPDASVRDEAVVVGGNLNSDSGVYIGGERVEISLGFAWPSFDWLREWFIKGFLLARPIVPQSDWSWLLAGLVLALYLLLAALFPAPVEASVAALERNLGASFLLGFLGLILLGPLLFLLVVSVAGLLVIPVVLVAAGGVVLLGKMAVYRSTGCQFGKTLNLAGLQQPFVALLVGLCTFYLLYTIPVVGFVAWGLGTVLGIGAVILAIFSSFSRSSSTPNGGAASPPITVPAQSLSQGALPPPPSEGPADFISCPRAGFWIRLVATLLDFVLMALLIPLLEEFFLLIWTAYHIVMWTWKGTTIGGIVTGLKVLRSNGEPVTFAVALVRSLSSFFSALALCIGFFWAGWDRDRQAWHDKIAGTVIVRVPRGISLV